MQGEAEADGRSGGSPKKAVTHSVAVFLCPKGRRLKFFDSIRFLLTFLSRSDIVAFVKFWKNLFRKIEKKVTA